MTATEQESGNANGVSDHLHGGASSHQPLIPDEPLDLESLCARIYHGINSFLENDADTDILRKVQEQTKVAVEAIARALDTYSLSQLSLSYNGGKDCLVLLVLYLYALYASHLRTSSSDKRDHFEPIQSVYIQSPHPFPEVESFVISSERTYSLALKRYTTPMKSAFASYLADNPNVQAIFVGTRRTDPHGSALTHFDETDHGWPKFMRIHPVIDWRYAEIWSFIRHLEIPYCSLYDKGYTSLGGTTDTLPNPALRLPTATGADPIYLPAHVLISDDEERLGRELKRDTKLNTLMQEEKGQSL